MRVDGLNPSYGVTKNGNPYEKSKWGKRAGTTAGVAYIAASTAHLATNGALKRPLARVMVSLRNLGVKNPKMLSYGALGAGALLATALAAGVGKLVGHCVDKFVEAKRKKAADRAAQF